MGPRSFFLPTAERGKLMSAFIQNCYFFNSVTNTASTLTDTLKITWKRLIFFFDHLGTSYMIFGSVASTFTVFYNENLYLEEDKERQNSEWSTHAKFIYSTELTEARKKYSALSFSL